jgi:Integrase core domain
VPSAPPSPRTAPRPPPSPTFNGLVFTTRLAGGKGGRNALETELRRLGIIQKNGRPNHPQTQGKAGRFQQTLKKWLAARAAQPATLTQLQDQLDAFTDACNTRRPHKSLEHRAIPATAYAARPRATPGDRTSDTHDRVRRDRIDSNGTVTLRVAGRPRHLGIGRTHVLLLVHDLHVRVIHAATGELLRELTIEPSRDYQATGRPPGPERKTP